MTRELRSIEVDGLSPILDEAGGFEGYGVTWNVRDSYVTDFEPGCVTNVEQFVRDGYITLSHDRTKLPIGYVEEAYSDDIGFFIRVRFHSTEEAQAARAVMIERSKAGKRIGLSIQFYGIDGVQLKDRFSFTAIEMVEVSFVNEPSNPTSTVTSVRSAEPPAGHTAEDDYDEALAAINRFLERAEGIRASRSADGRDIGATQRGRLETILPLLQRSVSETTDLLEPAPEPDASTSEPDAVSDTTDTVSTHDLIDTTFEVALARQRQIQTELLLAGF